MMAKQTAKDIHNIPVQVVNLSTGIISLDNISIANGSTVSDLRERLSSSSTDSQILVRNHLLELREDEKLVEVTEEGDTLTAFKRRSKANDDIEEEDDFFVVILSSVTQELVCLQERIHQRKRTGEEGGGRDPVRWR